MCFRRWNGHQLDWNSVIPFLARIPHLDSFQLIERDLIVLDWQVGRKIHSGPALSAGLFVAFWLQVEVPKCADLRPVLA